jgi:hypothetical protein
MSLREMQMGGWCVATTRIEVSQTMGLTGRGRVGRADPGGGGGARWLAEARRSEWEARGSSGWVGWLWRHQVLLEYLDLEVGQGRMG